MQILSNPDCQDALKPKVVLKNMICAIDPRVSGHGGPCLGDEGGPLAVKVNDRFVFFLPAAKSSGPRTVQVVLLVVGGEQFNVILRLSYVFPFFHW